MLCLEEAQGHLEKDFKYLMRGKEGEQQTILSRAHC